MPSWPLATPSNGHRYLHEYRHRATCQISIVTNPTLRLRSASLAIPRLHALPNTNITTSTLHEFLGSCSVAAILAGYVHGTPILSYGLAALLDRCSGLLLAICNVQLSVNVHHILVVCHMSEAPRSLRRYALSKKLLYVSNEHL